MVDGAKPFGAFERMVALRYLRPPRREKFVSVIAAIAFAGILLGVATLIVVTAVFNGFREELLTRILGINGHVIVQAVDQPMTDYEALSARLAAIPGVRAAIPLIEGQVLASGVKGPGQGVLVRGLSEASLAGQELIANNIKAGELAGFDGAESVVIGVRMAEKLGVGAGGKITLIAPEGDITPLGTTPRIKAYLVKAVFEVGMSDYDSSIVLMPLTEAQLYFNSEGQAQSVEIFLANADAVDDIRVKIEEAALRPVYVTDWRQRNKTFFDILNVQRNVIFMILSLIVLVAALNIISSLIMLVKEKRADIGILRTIGASRGAVMRIFLMAGVALGAAGTLAGVALGALIALNVESVRAFASWLAGKTVFDPELYYLSSLPSRMEAGEILAIAAMALGLSFLATLIPAWRAARLDPVEILRSEA